VSERQDGDRPAGGGSDIALTAADVAIHVGGELIGDPAVTITGVATLDQAGPDHLSFLAVSKYAPDFARSNAGVVLIAPDLVECEGPSRARIVVERPHEALLRVMERFQRGTAATVGIHPTARVGRGTTLGKGLSIGPYAVIEDFAVIGDRVSIGAHSAVGLAVRIGDDSHIRPHVTLYSGTELGRRVIIHSGCRIGADGFGYVTRGGAHEKIPHVGRCVIEDDVEIGANSTVDRGSVGDTVIGAGTKIDNLVQIGHNVRIGRLCLIVSQAGIAGSTRIEDGCLIGGQAGIGGHLTIGKGARIGGQAGVFSDVPAGESWSGYPARPHREALRAQAALFRLAPLMRKLERLLGRDSDPPGDKQQ
jgi:UDP-3-O-[3-hydroxymyristoyl] glucosamine N-acyltransferase